MQDMIMERGGRGHKKYALKPFSIVCEGVAQVDFQANLTKLR